MGQSYAEKRPQDLCSSPPAPHILRGKESHFEQETSTFSKTIRLVWNTSSFSLHHKSSLVKIENFSCLILEFKLYTMHLCCKRQNYCKTQNYLNPKDTFSSQDNATPQIIYGSENIATLKTISAPKKRPKRPEHDLTLGQINPSTSLANNKGCERRTLSENR